MDHSKSKTIATPWDAPWSYSGSDVGGNDNYHLTGPRGLSATVELDSRGFYRVWFAHETEPLLFEIA